MCGKRRSWACLGAALALLLLFCAGCDPGVQGPTVVVVCVEALRADYPDRASVPTLDRLAAEGGRADRLMPVFPTNSAPNLAAIATGNFPLKSGLVNNRFFDRRQGVEFEGEREEYDRVLLAEPIWATAVRQGVPAAAINWPGSSVAYKGIRASEPSRLDDANDAERVEGVVRWLSDTSSRAPRLILVYLDEVDTIGHEAGGSSEFALRAVERVDSAVATIQEALVRHRGAENSTLFVLGDHGMTDVSRVVYLQGYFAQKGFRARSFSTGGSSNIYLESGADPLAIQQIMAADAELFTAYLPSELPEEYAYADADRVGDLVVIGKEGTYLRDLAEQPEPVGPAKDPGMHGYGPEHPDMATAFYAWGRGVPAGTRWPELRIVDVHSAISNLLGLTPPEPTDGQPIPGIQAP